MATYRVWSDDAGEMTEVEATTPERAVEVVESLTTEACGNIATYRVEESPDVWVKYTIRAQTVIEYETRSKGRVAAPPIDGDGDDE